MRILELQEYAKENGFDSLKFKFTNLAGETKTGQWIDAWYGLFRTEGMEDNEMITVKQWREMVGDCIEFQLV